MSTRSENGKRRANCTATLLSAITLTVFLGCGAALTDTEQSVYPRFSLVGDLPDRVTELELTIDAPDIETIQETISPDDGAHVVELPPGEQRFIELLTIDDVYSGDVTADFPDPGEYEITVPMTPGPIIPDPGNERLVQIRDISGAGRRELGADGIGTLDDFQPSNAAYDDDGYLWVADYGVFPTYGLIRTGDFFDDQTVDVYLESTAVDALAVDSDRDRVYFWGFPDPGLGLYVLDTETGNASDEPIIGAEDLAEETIPDPSDLAESQVFGLDIDENGHIVAAVNTNEFGNWFWVVRIDPDADEDLVVDSLAPEALGWDVFDEVFDPLDVVRDVNVIGNEVYATLAIEDGFDALEYPQMLRFDADFNPDSIDAVTPQEGEFLGPQRFVAKREESGPIIVTDWDGDPDNARLLAFDPDEEEWEEYSDAGDPFAFFELVVAY